MRGIILTWENSCVDRVCIKAGIMEGSVLLPASRRGLLCSLRFPWKKPNQVWRSRCRKFAWGNDACAMSEPSSAGYICPVYKLDGKGSCWWKPGDLTSLTPMGKSIGGSVVAAWCWLREQRSANPPCVQKQMIFRLFLRTRGWSLPAHAGKNLWQLSKRDVHGYRQILSAQAGDESGPDACTMQIWQLSCKNSWKPWFQALLLKIWLVDMAWG